MRPCLLAFVDDLYYQSQIEDIAQTKEIETYFVTHGEQLSQLVKTLVPFMLLIDLAGLDSEWIFRHISQVKMDRPHLPVVAFVAPLREDVRDRAEKYGCQRIMVKTELLKQLPQLIEDGLRGIV